MSTWLCFNLQICPPAFFFFSYRPSVLISSNNLFLAPVLQSCKCDPNMVFLPKLAAQEGFFPFLFSSVTKHLLSFGPAVITWTAAVDTRRWRWGWRWCSCQQGWARETRKPLPPHQTRPAGIFFSFFCFFPHHPRRDGGEKLHRWRTRSTSFSAAAWEAEKQSTVPWQPH